MKIVNEAISNKNYLLKGYFATAAIFVYYRSFYDNFKHIERFDITCFRVYTISYFWTLKGQGVLAKCS